MAGVTFDLARNAIVDPLTAGIAVVSLAALLRWRPSSVWVVVGGACVAAIGRLF
jgi:chromate transporter